MARMMRSVRQGIALAALAMPAAALAAGPPPAGIVTDAVPLPADGDAYRVEHVDGKDAKQPTLRFLRSNDGFFRTRLDELRVVLRDDWEGNAGALEPEWLRWREMLAEIGTAQAAIAAGDSLGALDDITDLVELEHELDAIEDLLAAQGQRLLDLEDHFLGSQRTALVVLLTGVPSTGAPHRVVLHDANGGTARIDLDEADRTALARGGAVELLHRLVEPRGQAWTLDVERGDVAPASIPLALDPPRDRMTFVELDLSTWTPDGGDAVLRTWVR
jgi:hypothetical protein